MQVIIIARLHAMYQQSGRMLMFLIAIFLAITIACGAITATLERHHLSYGTHSLLPDSNAS